MTLEELRSLLTYNEWANARTFTAIGTLSDEQLTKDLGSSFPSILLTAGHMVGAEWAWLQRWVAESPTVYPEWVLKPTLGDLGPRLQTLQNERARFLSSLSDADLATPRPFKLFSGVSDQQPLEVMIRHVVNHASYHRGQIATMMRQVGAKATGTDYILYARETRQA
jgi:uncharacterized damage-inducible protein DinB